MKRRIVVQVFVLGVSLLASVLSFPALSMAQPPEYGLDEVLERARRHEPLLQEHEARQDFAKAQQERADRAWWPTLTAQSLLAPVPAKADPTRIDRNIDEILALNLGPYFRQTARLTMPIFTFGRIKTAQELADLGVDVSQYQRQGALQDHLLRTRQAYYGRQLSRAFGELLAEGDELVKTTLDQMEEDRAFGEASFDVEDLRRLQIFNAELDVMLLDNGRLRDLTEAALRYLADLEGPIQVPALRAEEADLPLGELELYQELAREHRPEIQQLELAIRARELQADLARRDFFPNFFIAADFGYGWSTERPAMQRICRRTMEGEPCINSETLYARPYSNPFDTLTFGIALGMQWRFEFAQQQGKLKEARARYRQTLAQQERALGAIELEVEEAWRTAADARERMKIEERRLDVARRWRNQKGLQAEMSGGGDIKDALDPLKAYYEAQVSVLEAAHAYLAARAVLARAVGLEQLEEAEGSGSF